MSEESERPTQPDADPGRRALPAKTGGSARGGRLGEWVARTLDIVEMMADATRDALIRKRG